MMFRRTTLAAAAAAAAVALATGGVQAQSGPRFTLELLPTLGGSTGSAAAVNDAGQVVGRAQNSQGVEQAFIWRSGTTIRAISGATTQASEATAINENGVVAGAFVDLENNQFSYRPFLWSPGGAVTTLPTYQGLSTRVHGVNDRNEVVGTAAASGGRAIRWSADGGVVRLSSANQVGSAFAINNSGQVAGMSGPTASERLPTVWSAANLATPLVSAASARDGQATAINNLGEVVGRYYDDAGLVTPFIWSAAAGMLALPAANSRTSLAGINDSALVVGTLTFAASSTAVALRRNSALIDLSTLTGTALSFAVDTNNLAQIATNSRDRAYLLTLHPDWTGGDGQWNDNTGQRWNFAGLGAAGTVGAPHDVVINPGVSATVRGAAQGQARSLRVGGTAGQVVVLDLNGGTTSVGTRTTLDEGGVLRGQGRHQGDVSIGGQGRVEVSAGQTMQIAGDLAQQGVVDVRASTGQARLHVTGSWAARGQTQLLNAELRADGGMSNDGLLHVTGFSQVLGRVDNRSGGRIQVSGTAGEAVFWDAVVNNGNVNVTSQSTATFFGAVSGAGGFSGAGTKHFAGGYNPGNSPGRATLEGGVVFDGGTLLMELAGVAPGTQHDKLVFENASVVLRGGVVLNLVLLDGYSPVLGDRFDLFDWNGSLDAASGSFGELLLPTLAGGLVWDVSRLYLSGDIGVTAVPEPQTWVLMALGLMGVALRRRDTTAAQRLQEMLKMAH